MGEKTIRELFSLLADDSVSFVSKPQSLRSSHSIVINLEAFELI